MKQNIIDYRFYCNYLFKTRINVAYIYENNFQHALISITCYYKHISIIFSTKNLNFKFYNTLLYVVSKYFTIIYYSSQFFVID